MGMARIIKSSANDEELLIPPVEYLEALHSIEHAAPTCCCCFNTKIGSYLIAMFQIFISLSHLISIGQYIGMLDDATNTQTIHEILVFESPYALHFAVFLSTYSLIAGVMGIYGLRNNKGRYMRYPIIVHFISLFILVKNLLVLTICWDYIGERVRGLLMYVFADIDVALSEEMEMQPSKQLSEQVSEWHDAERYITNDELWEVETKDTVLTVISLGMMLNVLTVAWALWVLLSHRNHMMKKGHY